MLFPCWELRAGETDARWVIIYSDISAMTKIGSGCYGSTVRALPDGRDTGSNGQGDVVRAEEGHARGGDAMCRGIKVRSSGAGACSVGRQGPSGKPGTAQGEHGLYPTGDSGEQGRPRGNLCSRWVMESGGTGI